MSEVLFPHGFAGEQFEVVGSIRCGVDRGVMRRVYVKGSRADLGDVIEDGWSGGPETSFVVLNVSPFPSGNMPPLWRRVVGERDLGTVHEVFVQGHVGRGKRTKGLTGPETIVQFPKVFVRK